MTVLVVAEHDHKTVRASTLSVITAAKKLSDTVTVLVAGYHCQLVADELTNYVNTVFYADAPCYEHALAETMASLIVGLAPEFSHVLMPATSFGKNILPRVAAVLDVGQVSDVIEIIDNSTYKRPIYAGNAIASVQSEDKIQLLTLRSSAFPRAEYAADKGAVMAVNTVVENTLSYFISKEQPIRNRPELASADTVISGGRGIKDRAMFERLEKIADTLGAAVGASRAAVDSGLAPNEYQVGQTGQIVSPKLYIALGISGAIQHVAGMKDSKVIVAINQDAQAPIFEIADYGLVADLEEILTEWEALLA